MSERQARLRRLLRAESDETLRVWLAVGLRAADDCALPARRRDLAADQVAACAALLAKVPRARRLAPLRQAAQRVGPDRPYQRRRAEPRVARADVDDQESTP